MNFDWTEKDKDFKNRVAGLFAQGNLPEPESLEHAELPELERLTREYLGKLAEIGYLSVGIGPSAATQTMELIAGQEELARVSSSLFLAAETSARLFGGLVAGFGEAAHVQEFLDPLCRGELIGAVAVSEAEDAQGPSGFRTTAYQDGQEFVLSGKKSFVTNGPVADYLAIVGYISEQPAVFLVERGLPGLIVGPRLQTLGYNGLAVASIELDNVRIPRSRILGPFDDKTPLDFLRSVEDMVLAVGSVGLMQRIVAEARQYAGSYNRGGKAIFSYQETRFKLAEMLTLTQTAQLLTYRAGWMAAVADPEARTTLHCAKVFAAEASEKVASLAMQIMAGKGYVSGNVVERCYREAKFAGIAGTTCEIARMSIADDLLRQYRV
ncbi:MAG: acyl-CoA dehydrogenase family protein [Desulfomonilaceae bacterium]